MGGCDRAGGATALSRDNYRRHFVGFFNFAVKQGFAKANPAALIETVSIDEKIPEIFTVAEVERVLLAAESHFPEMVPYFAIGFLAGLRPNEIELLNWRDIDLTRRRIVVRPDVAKRRRQRYVDISENLARWLAPYRKDQGPMHFSRHQFEKAREQAKVHWPHDVMRHSYGSYHLAQYEDAARTSLRMGHTSTMILFNHYRDLVHRGDAERYWQILPKQSSGLIELGRPAASAAAEA